MRVLQADQPHVGGDLDRGCYDARRAAALAGVPQRTLHYWAERKIYQPSIAPEPRIRLWSWLDLVALRAIDWMRKGDEEREKVNAKRIRQALEELDLHGIPRSRLHDFLRVGRSGDVYMKHGDVVFRAEPGHQTLMQDTINPVQPYNGGPDLLTPRPRLRIIPGKLLGEPHLVGTRIPSATIYTLHQQGYSVENLLALYPDATHEAVAEAIDLERSLSGHAA